MVSTDRREFLASSFCAAGATALPAWLAKWFTPQDPDKQQQEDEAKRAKERLEQLRLGVQKAKDEGKPLLVFVVPTQLNSSEAWQRGEWFGAFLNHGGSLALLEMALGVPACGTIADVRKVTGAASIEGNPLMLVVDVSQVGLADAAAPRVTPLVLDLGSPRGDVPGIRGMDEAALEKQKTIVEAGLAKMTAELHATLHRHGASSAKLVADVAAKATDAQRAAIAAWITAGGKVPSDELLVRFAAQQRSAAAELKDADRERVLVALESAARNEVVKKRIPGSRWASSQGCGTTIERSPGEVAPMGGVACGMGSVPPMCDRFLEFYVHG